MAENAAGLLQRARGNLLEARKRLVTPNPPALRQCSELIEESLEIIKQANADISDDAGSKAALRESAHLLRREISEVQSLLLSCFSFFAGWSRLHGDPCTSYRPSGPRLEIMPGHRLRVEG